MKVYQVNVFSPDIIHLHNIHGYYVNYHMLFEFLSRYQRKVIWTLHDCWPFTGHCAYYNYSKCEKWKAECEKCANRKEYPAAWRDASRDNYLAKKSAFLSVKDMTIVTPRNGSGARLRNPSCRMYRARRSLTVLTCPYSDRQKKHSGSP